MKIVKVRNDLMYRDANNPQGFHYYAFFWNKKYRRYNAIQLTHIARKDSTRYKQADSGLIKAIRIKQLDKYSDSGIRNTKYISDINGNALHPNMGTIIINKVSGSSSVKIMNFAHRLYSQGRKIKQKKIL